MRFQLTQIEISKPEGFPDTSLIIHNPLQNLIIIHLMPMNLT